MLTSYTTTRRLPVKFGTSGSIARSAGAAIWRKAIEDNKLIYLQADTTETKNAIAAGILQVLNSSIILIGPGNSDCELDVTDALKQIKKELGRTLVLSLPLLLSLLPISWSHAMLLNSCLLFPLLLGISKPLP